MFYITHHRITAHSFHNTRFVVLTWNLMNDASDNAKIIFGTLGLKRVAKQYTMNIYDLHTWHNHSR